MLLKLVTSPPPTLSFSLQIPNFYTFLNSLKHHQHILPSHTPMATSITSYSIFFTLLSIIPLTSSSSQEYNDEDTNPAQMLAKALLCFNNGLVSYTTNPSSCSFWYLMRHVFTDLQYL